MLKQIADRLDLVTALKLAESNDMLPPREDDKVSGEVGKRFVEYLKKQIDEDRYEPEPASFVQVPKPGFTSRPAALLTLKERVTYEAIVALLRPRLANYLMADNVVFWPREIYVKKRWNEFESAPLCEEGIYIVQADVSGFYESIDHVQLEDDIVQSTGERQVARSLYQFLARIMNARRGLPQGLLPSDTLATLFLQPVDATMLREGFEYWRHGDDIKVACQNMSRAREAISILEETLRKRGLLLNSSKVAIFTRAQYEDLLQSGNKSIQNLKTKLLNKNITKVASDSNALADAMKRAQLDDQWGWDLFYHKSVSVEAVINQIREHLAPTDGEVAEQVFLEAIEHAPGSEEAFSKEQFHFLITRSLLQLAAARSPIALNHSASIIARFSEKTEVVCQYLQALIKSHGSSVIASVEDVVKSAVFVTPWQQAWLFRILDAGAEYLSDDVLTLLSRLASNQSVHWLARVESMKVLARSGKIDRELVTRSWSLAPSCYRSDLLAVAARVSNNHEWARKFLQSSREPVEQVIARHLIAKNEANNTQIS